MSGAQRRYGFFTCPTCKRGWESSWAWCYPNTNTPSSGQQCQNPGCDDTYIKPHRVERLKCSICGSDSGCSCHDNDDNDDERHVDPNKPHRSDLCERCIRGLGCQHR